MAEPQTTAQTPLKATIYAPLSTLTWGNLRALVQLADQQGIDSSVQVEVETDDYDYSAQSICLTYDVTEIPS